MSHLRRPILKRACLWTAAVVLVVVSYVAGAPMVGGWISYKFPATLPVMRIIYASLLYYAEGSLPGAESYRQYAVWCHREAGLTTTPETAPSVQQ